MDALSALRLQIEWGADEALEDAPVDRLRAVPPPPAPLPQGEGEKLVSAPPPLAGGGLVERAVACAAAAGTLEELRGAIAAFDGCGLRNPASNLVFAEGDPAANLVLIGEPPAADDDRSGSAFAGAAGAYLDRMLAAIELERGRLMLTPLIPWRPPGDRPPSPAELAVCLPFLHRLIALVAPRRIVALGPLPTRALLGAIPIRRRASPVWQDASIPGRIAAIPILTMPSPAILLRVPTQRRSAWADLRLLRRSLDADLTQK